jgi:HD-GYP domain-containing protein (c-di-GMP phosphodiesterase class II)
MLPLRQKDINFLHSCGITNVWTEGRAININKDEPELEAEEEELAAVEEVEEVVEEKEEIIEEEVEEEDDEENNPATGQEQIKFSIQDVKENSGPYRAYKSLIDKSNTVFTCIKSGIDLDIKTIDGICDQLLQDLQDYRVSFIDFILGGEVTGHELAKSSVNTAILSALTDKELDLPDQKIHNIVVGALLHDVGMLRLSKGITEKKGGLSDAELEQIKSHPLHTSKIVSKELFGSHEINLIALQHHERWDGNGYPDRIAGDAIDIGARIVSVADAFEAMVSKKPYRNSLVGYEAVKNLMADNSRRFDPAVIMGFTKIMGIYPIGSIVRLNNRAIARVIRVHTDATLRPVIQILINERGAILRAAKQKTIDLLADRTLFIKHAINPVDFTYTDV